MMLTWEEVRSMANQGVTFGGHTVSHPILSRLFPEKARDEIVGSKKSIESKTGTEATLFAYPNGKKSDYSPQVMALVKEAGFRGAVTTEFGCNGLSTNALELYRMRPWEGDLETFALRLAAMSFHRPR
jgi:peptidoglycan/xylan/chitin deacetylase (PgdA/CDA1 family)